MQCKEINFPLGEIVFYLQLVCLGLTSCPWVVLSGQVTMCWLHATHQTLFFLLNETTQCFTCPPERHHPSQGKQSSAPLFDTNDILGIMGSEWAFIEPPT